MNNNEGMNNYQQNNNMHNTNYNDQYVNNTQMSNNNYSSDDESDSNKNKIKNLIIMILSMINIVLLFLLKNILFSIIAIILLIVTIINLKNKDIKNTISFVINLISVVVSIVFFIISMTEIGGLFKKANLDSFRSSISTVVAEAEQNKVLGNYKKCEEFESYKSSIFKSCTVNYSGESPSVTIEGTGSYKNYCVYNASYSNLTSFLIEECKNDNIENSISSINTIEYSTGGGYGTEINTATKTITIVNGKITLSNSYDSTTKVISISDGKYKELTTYISNNIDVFKNKPSEDNTVLDGGYSSLKVILEDGTTYKVDGYMISNHKYNQIVNKIFESFDKSIYNEYVNNIGKSDIETSSQTKKDLDLNTFHAFVSAVLVEALENKNNSTYKKCEEFSSFKSLVFKSCSVDYYGEQVKITIEGSNNYLKKYCASCYSDLDMEDYDISIKECK